MCGGGSGLLVGEVVRSDSWRVERESWRVEWRDRKATILSDVAAVGSGSVWGMRMRGRGVKKSMWG